MKNFFKNPWTISLGSVIVGFLLTVMYDILKGNNILSTVDGIISSIIKFCHLVLNFQLKVWWVLAGLTVIIGILVIIAKINESRLSQEEEAKPPFIKYTKEQIKGWCWEWRWFKNLYGEYDIDNLHPVCSSCGTPLVRSYNFKYNLECMRCNRKYGEDLPDLNNIKIYILDSAKRGIYRKDKN